MLFVPTTVINFEYQKINFIKPSTLNIPTAITNLNISKHFEPFKKDATCQNPWCHSCVTKKIAIQNIINKNPHSIVLKIVINYCNKFLI